MSKRRSKSYNKLRSFLFGNRLQELEVACAERVSEFTLPTIPAICKHNFFSVKLVILASLGHFMHQVASKTFEQLARSINLPHIFFRLNVKETVTLIRATRKRIFSLLNTMFSCRNRPFPQLIGCRKWLLQNMYEKLRRSLGLNS